jgi:HlyD family secretion protein
MIFLSAGGDLLRPDITEVERSTITVGEVKRGDFLLRVGEDGVMLSQQTAELDVSLPAKQIGDVQLGQPASVKLGGVKFPGKVTRIDSPRQISTDQVIVPVIVALADVLKDAHSGSQIEGRIDVMTIKDALYVPSPVLAPAQTSLYRLNSDQTSANPVKVEYGRIGTDLTEIRSGLNPGDRVIVSITAQYEPFGKIALR